MTLFPGPPHPAVAHRKPGPRAPGVHPAQRSTLQAGRLRPRWDPHGRGCANDRGEAANAKALQGAGHADTLPPGAALPARVPEFPGRGDRARRRELTCLAAQQVSAGLRPGPALTWRPHTSHCHSCLCHRVVTSRERLLRARACPQRLPRVPTGGGAVPGLLRRTRTASGLF